MSSVVDVSGRLGEYMLKGWVLTDKSCPTPGCSVPMMRSPNGRKPITHFCANCDDGPGVRQSNFAEGTSDASSTHTSVSLISRSSTPPTEVSSTLSSPVFAPPTDTEESMRRREQSDRASSEIGKRLLQGWAMLADECVNGTCYGIPLVRPPKTSGEKDPRKECVICGNVYLTEADWAGREHLTPGGSRPVDPEINSTVGVPRSRVNAKTPENILPVSRNAPGDFSASGDPLVAGDSAQTEHVRQTLGETSKALQSTLSVLSTHLMSLIPINNGRTTMDPSSMGTTVDMISKVTQALSHVRQLQWSESQAQRL